MQLLSMVLCKPTCMGGVDKNKTLIMLPPTHLDCLCHEWCLVLAPFPAHQTPLMSLSRVTPKTSLPVYKEEYGLWGG